MSVAGGPDVNHPLGAAHPPRWDNLSQNTGCNRDDLNCDPTDVSDGGHEDHAASDREQKKQAGSEGSDKMNRAGKMWQRSGAGGIGGAVFAAFVSVFVGLVANKVAMRIKWMDDPAIKVLQSTLAEKDKQIQQLKLDCVSREAYGYAQCESEIIRPVILSAWVIQQLEIRAQGKAREVGEAIKNAL